MGMTRRKRLRHVRRRLSVFNWRMVVKWAGLKFHRGTESLPHARFEDCEQCITPSPEHFIKLVEKNERTASIQRKADKVIRILKENWS